MKAYLTNKLDRKLGFPWKPKLIILDLLQCTIKFCYLIIFCVTILFIFIREDSFLHLKSSPHLAHEQSRYLLQPKYFGLCFGALTQPRNVLPCITQQDFKYKCMVNNYASFAFYNQVSLTFYCDFSVHKILYFTSVQNLQTMNLSIPFFDMLFHMLSVSSLHLVEQNLGIIQE